MTFHKRNQLVITTQGTMDTVTTDISTTTNIMEIANLPRN